MDQRNFKLLIAYEGTNFLGWQRQMEGPTVQGLLEDALARVCDHQVTLHGSGRTDAGVHAAGQVANFLTASARTPRQLVLGVNSQLPPEIAVLKAEETHSDFHARFDCQGKYYSYDYNVSPVRNPLLCRQSWFIGSRLDWDSVAASFEYLLGEHDFAAFQSHGSPVKSTVRTLTKLELTQIGPELVRLSVFGTGFLRHMVRTIAGTLYQVGLGHLKSSDLTLILEGKDRRKAGVMAPAQGLCLRKVFYQDWPF
ncbi:MAG: tRNA pseudouridine(38-40) synthase TruA [Deltaproteobacteria bacterium]|jgi:tRNA pseudouridine38-40 synthase|nr:tRNA pseudouridine(38-40) synthase TruA [Deltaproteobacteria bacterium]